MEHLLTKEEFDRMTNELDKVKYECRCGHKEVITSTEDKKICSWCGRYIFRDKRDEFNYRISEQIKRRG